MFGLLRSSLRRILGRSGSRQRRVIPAAVRPSSLQPALPTFGADTAAIRGWFESISIDGSAHGELAGYARHDFERFLRTVELVPSAPGTGLEIGANPYFTTMLLSWFRPDVKMCLTNFFGKSEAKSGVQVVEVEGISGIRKHALEFSHVNIESDRLPYDDESFDVVLYCEVLEHMTNDPVRSLREIRRVIKPGGCLVLTTPNAARLEAVTRLLAGLNIYDQYSGYGPYGRHNREYTANEVQALLQHCGFDQEILYTADVHANHAALHVRDPGCLVGLVGHRRDHLGQYIFSRWRKADRAIAGTKPAWLYRSVPADALSTEIPLTEPNGARF